MLPDKSKLVWIPAFIGMTKGENDIRPLNLLTP